MHVDDFTWSGTTRFCDEVIEKVRTAFLCGKEADNAFKYIGLDVEHSEDGILLAPTRIHYGHADDTNIPHSKDENS